MHDRWPLTLHSLTGLQPVDCRASRHGPNSQGFTTWIISYKNPVPSFRLFGVSNYSKEIQKHPTIQRHDAGCQGYCNPARCTKAVRSGNCGDRTESHEGPTGPGCTYKTKCANCPRPHRAGHTTCPAVPHRVNGRLIKPTKKELKTVRKGRAQDVPASSCDGPIFSTLGVNISALFASSLTICSWPLYEAA